MDKGVINTRKGVLWLCIFVPALMFSTPAVSATANVSPTPGAYCPGKDVLLIKAEELSASLDLVMRSRAAFIEKDQVVATYDLASAGTTLHLAASRGAAARTIVLINAIIQSKDANNYAHMLEWFPLLQTSLLTLPDDATVSAASDLVGRALEIIQGDVQESDPLVPLNQARHMLSCDDLDIPLQQAILAQEKLMKVMNRNEKVTDYDDLIGLLRTALEYTMKNGEAN